MLSRPSVVKHTAFKFFQLPKKLQRLRTHAVTQKVAPQTKRTLIFCFLFALVLRMASKASVRRQSKNMCPERSEIRTSGLTVEVRKKIWLDLKCRSGCMTYSEVCHNKYFPCCVVYSSIGLRRKAVLTCTRQLDNSLFMKIEDGDIKKILEYCERYLALQFHEPNCSGRIDKIPRILHTVSRDNLVSYNIESTLRMNNLFQGHHVDDKSALVFIEQKCGSEVAKAFSCIRPPAFRADLYRFCALYAVGGVYLDNDILPLRPLREIYSPCSSFSLGYDQAQGLLDIKNIGMQMKILASAPGHELSKCMMKSIVENVRYRRQFKKHTFAFSGPQLLRKCYELHSDDVSITYMDTRGADWPYAGLRAGTNIFAYEIPSASRHFGEVVDRDRTNEYNDMVNSHNIYTANCEL